MKLFKIFLFLLLLFVEQVSQAETLKVSIGLNWYPEVEHGGYFAAEALGYYNEDPNLNIQLLSGGPNVPLVAQLASGKIDFAVMNADDVLLAREQGIPLVSVAGGIDQSPLCLMVHEKSPIKNYDDLQEVTLFLSPSGPFTHYLKKKYPLNKVTIVPYTGSVAPFLINKASVSQAYVFSEPLIAEDNGVLTRCLPAAGAGFNPYTSILVTTEKKIQTDPLIVKKIAVSSIKGWREYLRDPKPAHALIEKKNKLMTNAFLNRAYQKVKPLISSQGDELVARMDLKRWQELVSQLKMAGLITKNLDVTTFVKNQ